MRPLRRQVPALNLSSPVWLLCIPRVARNISGSRGAGEKRLVWSLRLSLLPSARPQLTAVTCETGGLVGPPGLGPEMLQSVVPVHSGL